MLVDGEYCLGFFRGRIVTYMCVSPVISMAKRGEGGRERGRVLLIVWCCGL